MTRGFLTFMSCNPFSDARTSLLCFQTVPFREKSQTLLWNFATWCLVLLCRFPSSYFFLHSQRNPVNSFGKAWRKRIFEYLGKWLEHLESRGILCAHRPNFLTVPAGPGLKNLREWIQCLYNVVIDRLCVATSQSINDRKQQILFLNTKATSSDPSPKSSLCVLICITSRGVLKRTMCVFSSAAQRLV